MKFCKRCVQPDTRPSIRFNDEGICPACQYVDKIPDIDWQARKEELKEIIKLGKENNVSGYDCIIGVSGGKDSTRQALFVKEQLGLKPLLVSCAYPPEQQTERGAHNLSNMIALGFDTISISLAPQTWKKMMKEGFYTFGNIFKSSEMPLFASVPRVAIAYHIPLILWGDNPATQLGDLGVGSLNWNGNKMKFGNTIASGPQGLMTPGMTNQDIIWYKYPSDQEMEWARLQLVYLGYFMKDWSKVDNAAFSIAHGLEIRNDTVMEIGSLHPFESLDEDFVFVNQMLKCMKLGFGKVTDEVCEEIRLGRMTREKAIELVKKYDGQCDEKYILKFCKYLEITPEEFWRVAESYRNKDLWEKDQTGKWVLKYPPQ